MGKMIFINLPVKDLSSSMSFFDALGYQFNPQFTDDTAACMVISDTIYAMLLTYQKFSEFTPHPISNAKLQSEVLTALSFDSREELDRLVNKALELGATENYPAKDYGFMYTRSFSDLDGHIWESIWMDPSHVQ